MSESEKIILPEKYYLDYFKYLIEFVQKGSANLIGKAEQRYIEDFYALSEDAQCLLIRMLNRKGDFFRLDKLKYEEITSIPQAAEELVNIGKGTFETAHDPSIFYLFTKAELHKLFPEREFQKKKKEEILLELVEQNAEEDYHALLENYQIIQLLQLEKVDYIKMLFFGHPYGQMTEFVIRDIGNIQLENLENHTFKPWFDYEEEARATFELYHWNRAFKQAKEIFLPDEIIPILSEVAWDKLINHPNARKIGDKLMLRIAEYFEKSDFHEEAISYYQQANKHPARERLIRIYDKLDKGDEASEIADIILHKPYNASEQIFAKDYLAKTSKRNYRSTTAKIKTSPEITILEPEGHRVEAHALAHFSKQGYEGIHAENYLWRGIFGLIFWDELFDPDNSTFHHPLQRMSSDLHSEDHFDKRGERYEAKTKQFKTRKKLIAHIRSTYEEKKGINNHLVGWHESLLPSIESCIRKIPLKGLLNVMLEMAKNLKTNSTGFPDLFIWSDNDYHFYEIKSPNDHLSAQQLFWIDFLNEQNIKADILRVKYE
ncbi:MAG: VRR-NUC domain-containing protein [Cyclobacteriaceae bacterium]